MLPPGDKSGVSEAGRNDMISTFRNGGRRNDLKFNLRLAGRGWLTHLNNRVIRRRRRRGMPALSATAPWSNVNRLPEPAR
jgi:hypothetical protein